MIDTRPFLAALVQDDINVTSKVSHVLPIVNHASIKVQGHQIERLIQGKLITGKLIIEAAAARGRLFMAVSAILVTLALL